MEFAQPFSVLDGGLSTALEASGHDLDHSLWTARFLAERPEALIDAHLAYLRAGAEYLITSSYQASIAALAGSGLDRSDTIATIGLTTELAREAVARFREEDQLTRPIVVASSVGPYGATLADGSEYRGDYAVGDGLLRDFHLERLEILVASEPDVLACETIPSRSEARAINAALGELRTCPEVWMAFSCRDSSHTSAGDRIEDAAAEALLNERVVAVGVNCTAPQHLGELLERIATVTSVPLVAYANAGQRWDADRRRWTGDSERLDDPALLSRWIAAGARLVGGCCGVGPAEIGRLRAARDHFRPPDLAA